MQVQFRRMADNSLLMQVRTILSPSTVTKATSNLWQRIILYIQQHFCCPLLIRYTTLRESITKYKITMPANLSLTLPAFYSSQSNLLLETDKNSISLEIFPQFQMLKTKKNTTYINGKTYLTVHQTVNSIHQKKKKNPMWYISVVSY